MKFVFYDLETNGLDTSSVSIMQICVMDEENNLLMNNYVYPYDGNIDGTHIHGIDKEVLDTNMANEPQDMLKSMIDIIQFRYPEEDIYLMAYNNFGYDQQVLEYNFKRFNIEIPTKWRFTDLFPYIRDKYPQYKYKYRLSNIYEKLIQPLDENNTSKLHNASFDVEMMKAIYDKHKKDRYILQTQYTRGQISKHTILLYSINLIDGYEKSSKRNYIMNNINTIGDLYKMFINIKESTDNFDEYLKNKLAISSDFYRRKIITEMKNLLFFL